ncbi:MAG: hypothetical protein ACTSWH_07210 [Promethearchaeota archaeon]
MQTDKPELSSSDDEGLQELDKIVQYKKDRDQVENILDPKIRYREFKDIKNCPNCKSLNIIKKFNQGRRKFQT